jgi:hypothetical protein
VIRGASLGDDQHEVCSREREDFYRAPVGELPWIQAREAFHPVRGRTNGEFSCELSVREQGADLCPFAAYLSLLEDIPSFGIDQLEEGRAGEVV